MSTKVWYCANCGYEVTARGRCHSCGERLIASPVPELESGPDDDEVGYRLDQWDDMTRSHLIQGLIAAGILHRFEEEELVILAEDEAQVDAIVARSTGAAGAAADDDDDDADEGSDVAMGDANASRELYDAARRLREDPTDMQADAALGEASAGVFAVDYLPDLDEAHMAAVGRVTRRLLGALGSDEALEGEIRHQAEVLCRLIAPSAGPDIAEAEEERARARLEQGAKEKGRAVELPQSEVTPAGEMPLTISAIAAEAQADQAEDQVAGAGPVTATGELEAADDIAVVVAPGVALAAVPLAAGAEDPYDLGDEAEEAEEEDEDEGEEEGSGELVYELAEWLPEQRVELSMLLEGAGIPYNWDGTDLTVAEEHEVEVDGLFELVHGLVEEDDEARYRSIEELFGSVDRLANDPSNEERQKVFLEAVGAVELPTPVGVDDSYWWRVRSQGHALVAALEHDARIDEISREAALLAEMLHEMV
jgi:hypothetical protein